MGSDHLVLAFAGLLIGAIVNGLSGVPEPSLEAANSQYGGNLQGIAKIIFTDYIVAFEVTSALLIIAALGAMLLAHRERHAEANAGTTLDRSFCTLRGDRRTARKPATGRYLRPAQRH